MLYDHQLQPLEGCTNLSFPSYSHIDVAKSLSLSPHLLPFFAALVGNDQGGIQFGRGDADAHVGKVVEGKMYLVAEALERLRTLPYSTQEERTRLLHQALVVILGRDYATSNNQPDLDRLTNSASSYILPPSPAPPIPVDPSITPAFVLAPRSSDSPNQAKSRAIYQQAFSRGGIGSACLLLFKWSIVSPGYGYELTERKSTNIELGRPIRQWIYAIVEQGMGFAEIEGSRRGSARNGEVTEVVRSVDKAHFAQVKIRSLEDLCAAEGVSFDPTIPIILQPILNRMVLAASIFDLPADSFDFELDFPYLPIVCALLHIQRNAKYPFTSSDIKSALATAVILRTAPNPSSFVSSRPSITAERVQKSTQLVVTLYSMAMLWQVLALSLSHDFSTLFGGTLFHTLLGLGEGVERFLAGCPVEITSVVERLSAVVMNEEN